MPLAIPTQSTFLKSLYTLSSEKRYGVLVETYESHRPKSKVWHLRTHEVVETFQCGILLHDLGKGGWILTHMWHKWWEITWGKLTETNSCKYRKENKYIITVPHIDFLVNKGPSRNMKGVSFLTIPTKKINTISLGSAWKPGAMGTSMLWNYFWSITVASLLCFVYLCLDTPPRDANPLMV